MLPRLLQRIPTVRKDEARAVGLACLYFFFVLSGYYLMRPLREEMGLAGGVRQLPWLFLFTLGGMLLATPLFGALVGRFPRRRFLPLSYRFWMLNLLVFYLLLRLGPEGWDLWLGRVFYVWISVFNLFAVSVFWAFMADGFGLEQSKRLFGFLAVGGSLGALAGSALTGQLVERVGRIDLLLLAILLLELAVRSMKALGSEFERLAPDGETSAWSRAQRGSGGRPLEGVTQTLRSPYLRGIAAYLFLFTLGSTFLYFEQAEIVAGAVAERAARAALFADIDLWVNGLTLLTQLTLAGHVIPRLGVGRTLLLLPLLSAVGFLALGFRPVLVVLVIFQVLRRAGNYALVRPARETLYTILSRSEKYKAKSFLDTFVYRGGDALGALAFQGLVALGVGLAGVAFLGVPLALGWGGVALWLGRRQAQIASRTPRPSAPASSASPATETASSLVFPGGPPA